MIKICLDKEYSSDHDDWIIFLNQQGHWVILLCRDAVYIRNFLAGLAIHHYDLESKHKRLVKKYNSEL